MCVFLNRIPYYQSTISIPDKQVFPSLELIGWYTVTQQPTSKHIALHEQVRNLIHSKLHIC